MHPEQIQLLLNQWGETLAFTHPEISLDGSPERTAFRIVLENTHGQFLILEELSPLTLPVKIQIHQYLDYLKSQNLEWVPDYLINFQQKKITQLDNTYWQLSRYVKHTPLSRPEFLQESWRGESLAHILVTIKENSPSLLSLNSEPFLFQNYVRRLLVQIQKQRLLLLHRLQPFLTFLEHSLFALELQFPFRFVHGDLHPLNILWGDQSIRSLIDWEFCGSKAECYDLANFLGSIGFENPDALFSPLSKALLDTTKNQSLLSPLSLTHLGHWILALRFAWIAEWLRKNEEELLEQELEYMQLLLDHIHDLNAYFQK